MATSPTNASLPSPLSGTYCGHLPLTNNEVDNFKYRFEGARLQSFQNWPLEYIKPEEFAAAGFYYLGEDDKVQCFECKLEVWQWEKGDRPMIEHRRWSARCRFLGKEDCGNVPIGVDPNTVPFRPRDLDECSLYGLGNRPNSASDNRNSRTELQLSNTTELNHLGSEQHRDPRYPQYINYDDRIRTFKTWPISTSLEKEQLASAGFFYTGERDITCCYHCGGSCYRWKKDDDPWEEHAKLHSNCYFVLLKKGQDYMRRVTGQTTAPPSVEERRKMLQPQVASLKVPSMDMETKIEQIASTSSSKPCSHLGICVKCALRFRNCPICRQRIKWTIRVIF